MKVVQFRAQDYEAVGYLENGTILDFSRAARMLNSLLPNANDDEYWPYFSLQAMIETEALFKPEVFAAVREFVADHDLEEELRIEGAQLLSPIARPSRIIALGLNYAAHAAETGKAPPEEPIFFLKASTAVIGPEEPVVYPDGIGRLDHEVELAAIVGKGGRNIPREKAAGHIAGYTILNDVTARDMQTRDMAASRPWFLSKSFDTFAPMGQCVTLPDEIKEPAELALSLRVNGEVRQQSNTRDLIFDIPELIHRLSRWVTLEAGDIISTGTPSGISPLSVGDVMEAEIERIGVLRNPVIAGK
jgi:2-keto-4-pentenoate hydratase/2-oxohepta-3-ene-1,7-dioic acid hydratase in catechol pathway